MPILAGVISALFFKVFEVLAARLTFNVAFSAAMAAVMVAAFAAYKAALAAIWALVPVLVPTQVSVAFALIFPGNVASCVGAVILVDVIAVSWDYWKMMAGVVAATVKS